ncbi:hypothetical protein [Vibrio vulnificus YJ016]|uniref:Uncharacterized protein n=1 Tax=Vibrio vulnificus (strain YJ016) TaxID=196600 RepID=Q7MDE9_VIBVY|nr:hypothetical protein [Vibrio vulnificus YJ016]
MSEDPFPLNHDLIEESAPFNRAFKKSDAHEKNGLRDGINFVWLLLGKNRIQRKKSG